MKELKKKNLKQVGGVGESGLVAEIGSNEHALRPANGVVIKVTGAVSFANYEDVCEKVKKRMKQLTEEEKKVGIRSFSFS